MALNPAAIFYSSRMIPGSKNRVAKLVRVSAGRVDDRLNQLAGENGRLALTTAWILTSFGSTDSLTMLQRLVLIIANRVVASSSGDGSGGLHHLATSLP